MLFDMYNNFGSTPAFNIQAVTTDTTTNGSIIDTLGYESVLFVLQAGTLTDGTYTTQIQHGDNASLTDAATVTTSTGQIGASAVVNASNTTDRVAYAKKFGGKRYVRLNVVSTSTSSGGTVGATAVLGGAIHKPVS